MHNTSFDTVDAHTIVGHVLALAAIIASLAGLLAPVFASFASLCAAAYYITAINDKKRKRHDQGNS